MRDLNGMSIVITGASSGIGEDAARLLSEHGAKLMLGARRKDRLQDLVGHLRGQLKPADYKVTDVTRAGDVQALVDAAVAAYGRVDVLINNAGLMPLSFFSQGKLDEWERMVDVNIKGVLYGINAVLPIMQQQGAGHIINIASVAGHSVFPTGGVYCATKHAVRAITEGLRQESRGKYRTTIISPGPVATELTESISEEKVAAGMNKVYEKAINVSAISRAIVYAIQQPDDVDVNEIVVRPVGG